MLNLRNATYYNLKLSAPTTLTNTSVSTDNASKTRITVLKTKLTVNGGTDLSTLTLDAEGSTNDGESSDANIMVDGAASLGDVYLYGRARLYITDKSGKASAKNVTIGERMKNDGSYDYCERSLFEMEEKSKFKVSNTITLDTRWNEPPLPGSGGPCLYMRKSSQLMVSGVIKSYNSEHFIAQDSIVCTNEYWMQNKNDRGYTKIKFGKEGKLLLKKNTKYFHATTAATTGNCYASSCNNFQEVTSKYTSTDINLSDKTDGKKMDCSVSTTWSKDTSAWSTYCNDWYYKN